MALVQLTFETTVTGSSAFNYGYSRTLATAVTGAPYLYPSQAVQYLAEVTMTGSAGLNADYQPLAAYDAPTNVVASEATTRSMRITWTDNTSGVAYHDVYYRKTGDANWIPGAKADPGVVTVVIYMLQAGYSYDFAVASITEDGVLSTLTTDVESTLLFEQALPAVVTGTPVLTPVEDVTGYYYVSMPATSTAVVAITDLLDLKKVLTAFTYGSAVVQAQYVAVPVVGPPDKGRNRKSWQKPKKPKDDLF